MEKNQFFSVELLYVRNFWLLTVWWNQIMERSCYSVIASSTRSNQIVAFLRYAVRVLSIQSISQMCRWLHNDFTVPFCWATTSLDHWLNQNLSHLMAHARTGHHLVFLEWSLILMRFVQSNVILMETIQTLDQCVHIYIYNSPFASSKNYSKD